MADAISAFIRFKVAPEAKPICTVSKGESRHITYKSSDGWLELSELGWEITAETSFTEGGGASVGKSAPGNFTFKHNLDMAALPILGFIASGSNFSEVEIHVCKSTGANQTSPYLKIWLKAAYLTKASLNVGSDGKGTQDVEAVFKSIKTEYFKQDDTGKLGSESAAFEWDVQTTKASAGQPK